MSTFQEKIQPVLKSSGDKMLKGMAKKVAKTFDISKHDFCKIMEKQHGRKAAKEEFKKWH